MEVIIHFQANKLFSKSGMLLFLLCHVHKEIYLVKSLFDKMINLQLLLQCNTEYVFSGNLYKSVEVTSLKVTEQQKKTDASSNMKVRLNWQ